MTYGGLVRRGFRDSYVIIATGALIHLNSTPLYCECRTFRAEPRRELSRSSALLASIRATTSSHASSALTLGVKMLKQEQRD